MARLKYLLIFPLVVVILVSAVYRIPRYLLCRDKPEKADAVIFFVGHNYEVREGMVKKLIRDGYASKLIIPLYQKVFSDLKDGITPNIDRATLQDNIAAREHKQKTYPEFLENTHVEAIEAKRLMDSLGLKSAICVSSPYHMKRIRLIVDQVFRGNEYKITCVPAALDLQKVHVWFLHRDHTNWVVSESLKIAWFYLYEPFTRAAIEWKS
jgi:hypothetical protein